MKSKAEKSKKTIAGDIICAALLLAFSCLLFVFNSGRGNGGDGYVSVADGNGLFEEKYPLSESREYEIESANGYTLTLRIEDGRASITHSDCPNGYCVECGEISKPGQIIVCAPARIIVKVVGGGGDSDGEIIAG